MLELIGIIAGIVAAAFIVLFGSRGLVDLVRGIADRRKRVNDDPSTVQNSVVAAKAPPTIPNAIERPPSRLTEIRADSTGAVFVGRQRELATLKSALEDAMAGRGRVVMLAGEPGIGKTRTIEELASYATSTGSQVLWGRCYEDSGAPPYWPWIEVTRARVREIDDSQLLEQMGPGAAHIAEIVPEVRVKLPDHAAPPELEPEQARFQLFDSMTTFLANTSRSQPLVLALEDLHWADTSSLGMLDFLGSRIANTHLMVVGAYRDEEITPEHPLSQALGSLSAEPSFRLETLRRFSAEETASLIEATGGVPPTEELVQRIQSHTEGNPMFVGEVVRLLGEQGELEPSGADEAVGLAVPESVRAVTRQRLRGLSAECNQTLVSAAIVGREFDFGLIRRLLPDATEAEVLDALGEATRVRLVEELPQQLGRFQFSHSLIQQALAEGLSATARAQAHADIALALEAHYGDDVDEHAAELAYHFAEAQTVVGTEKLLRYSLLAGERALSAYAWEEASVYFQRGLTAKGVPLTGTQPAEDAETAAILFGLGRAQGAANEVREAWASLGRSFDYYVAAGDAARVVAVAEYPLFYVSGLEEPTRFVSQALALVPPESLEAGRLLSRFGLLLNLETGDYERATEYFTRALAIAQRENNEGLEMRTLAAASDVDFYRLRWSDALEKNVRVVELAQRANDPHSEAWPHWLAASSLLYLGRSEEAMAHATAMLRLAEKLHNRGFLASAWVMNANVAHTRGEWKDACDFYDRELSQGSDSFGFLAYRALVDYEVGDFSQGEARLDRCLELKGLAQPGPTLEYGFSAVVIPLVARITGDSDRLDVAGEAGGAVVGSPSAMTFFATIARTGLGLLAVLRDDAAAAGDHYAILRGSQGTMSPIVGTVVDRVLGLLAHTMGNLDQAMSHFEDSLAFCRKAGYRPELAWTCCDYADALRERNGEGDRAKAMSLLDESLALSSELGMRPLMERVLSRREILGA